MSDLQHFDEQLLDHIRYGRNDEAMAMLNEELAGAFNDSDRSEMLLHHAAEHNNTVIARRLIDLGADVDGCDLDGTTPLIIAVACQNASATQVLLEANAQIDIVDFDDRSALKLALDWRCLDSEASKLLFCKLRMQANTIEGLVDILIRAGCNLSHVVTLRDFDVMECMLKRGVDINSRDLIMKTTALHAIDEMGDVNLADWLLKKGVDVDALDVMGCSALEYSVSSGNKAMVQWLLEHGARPDVIDNFDTYSALSTAFLHMNQHGTEDGPIEAFLACAELLLQHEASLEDSEMLLEMFHCSCDKAVKLLIAHLAMLEMLGQPTNKSVMHSVEERHRAKIAELRKYYEPCQQALKIEMFERMSLLDLLQKSDRKMRLLARKETFFQEVDRISSEHKLKELYSYYYNSMMRRIEKASRLVKLEDEAILVICKIFEANYNQFYGFARGVVEYLNERDLENLVQV